MPGRGFSCISSLISHHITYLTHSKPRPQTASRSLQRLLFQASEQLNKLFLPPGMPLLCLPGELLFTLRSSALSCPCPSHHHPDPDGLLFAAHRSPRPPTLLGQELYYIPLSVPVSSWCLDEGIQLGPEPAHFSPGTLFKSHSLSEPCKVGDKDHLARCWRMVGSPVPLSRHQRASPVWGLLFNGHNSVSLWPQTPV